ncbi:hypothetical protein ACFWPP_00330 [Streptomyces anulatus]
MSSGVTRCVVVPPKPPIDQNVGNGPNPKPAVDSRTGADVPLPGQR